jgi:hypothetical protein
MGRDTCQSGIVEVGALDPLHGQETRRPPPAAAAARRAAGFGGATPLRRALAPPCNARARSADSCRCGAAWRGEVAASCAANFARRQAARENKCAFRNLRRLSRQHKTYKIL